jgi:Zn finger protein HypA/HybF involved in hydrogenase expression
MASRECARCHRIFEKVAFEEVCPTCFPIEENEFKRIKEYLDIHPGASSNEVMSELAVSLKSIKRYLKEDRLEIVGDNKGFIRCELCGKPVNSGRYCEDCYRDRKEAILKEQGLGFKSAYIQPDLQKSTGSKGIRYKGTDDKKG